MNYLPINDLELLCLSAFEKQFITDTLEQNHGHKGKTAAMLGIDRKTLDKKLKKYEVILG